MENRVANVLEAVRGLAALLVIVQHTTNFKNTHLGYYLDIGKFGVVIFFCISGYLMIASARKKSPGEFLVSRFFRLYPMYWVSIFLGIIVLGFDSLAQIFFNFTMFQQYFGFENIISVYWTLTIEIAFYAIVFLLMAANIKIISGPRSVLNVFFGFFVFLLLATLIKFYFVKSLPLAIFTGLSVMFYAAVVRDFNRPFLLLLLAMLIFPITYVGYKNEAVVQQFSVLRYSVTYSLALVAFYLALKCPFSPKFKFFGEYSYGTYLFHVPVFYLIFDGDRSIIAFIVTAVVTLVISGLLHHIVEKPFIAIGKEFARKKFLVSRA